MKKTQQEIAVTKFFILWHKRLSWVAGIAILVWAISGVSHPLMSWTGPKATSFYPPPLQVQSAELDMLNTVLAKLKAHEVSVAKIVPTEHGAMLQLTEDSKNERHYYSLRSGGYEPAQDIDQAVWLAAYYTGLAQAKVSDVEFLSEFDSQYSWVNRLLPVYKVSFSDSGGLVAYIHTETAALASLSNTGKGRMQAFFQTLHTWSFLQPTGFARVILIALLMISVFLMAASGIGLVLNLRSRKILDGKRRWHRTLSYVMWLPLLAWSISGFYHLLQNELVENLSGLRLAEPQQFNSVEFASNSRWLRRYEDRSIKSMSILRDGQQVLLRVGFATEDDRTRMSASTVRSDGKPAIDEHAGHDIAAKPVTRAERYAGRPSEVGAVYIDAQSGQQLPMTDRERAIQLASAYSGLNEATIDSVKLITHFGAGYDFRNKRLPVWAVSYQNGARPQFFIDPVTSVLVDQNRDIDRLESWSFGILHKWNHLSFIGRQNRDYLIVLTLGVLLTFTILGLLMRVRAYSRP